VQHKIVKLMRGESLSNLAKANFLAEEGERIQLDPWKLERVIEREPEIVVGEDLSAAEYCVLSGLFHVIDGKRSWEDVLEELCEGQKLVGPHGRTLQLGIPNYRQSIYTLSSILAEVCNEELGSPLDLVRSAIPLPFRDDYFDTIISFGIAEGSIVREAFRVLKTNGTLFLAYRDELFGGISAMELLNIVSSKFEIRGIAFREGYWIAEGVKTRKVQRISPRLTL